jgi:tetratricopeptide (TPR) repeat protein
VATVAELIDRGIKLYMGGRSREAREAFQLALDLDPSNAKARAYLAHIREAAPSIAPAPVPLKPAPAVPLPPPAATSSEGASPLAGYDPVAHVAGVLPVHLSGAAAPAGARAAGAAPGAEDAGDEYAPSPWDDGPAAPATIELEDTSEGLDLEAIADKSDLRPLVPEGATAPAAAPRSDVEVWLSAAKELFSLGDFSGSLELIEKILQVDPDHGEARDYLRQNEATLVSMYESKLGSLARIPRLAIKPEEVMWLNLDHRAGFLLAQIDGTVDFESLFALSGLPRLDTARILANLIADGVITS